MKVKTTTTKKIFIKVTLTIGNIKNRRQNIKTNKCFFNKTYFHRYLFLKNDIEYYF